MTHFKFKIKDFDIGSKKKHILHFYFILNLEYYIGGAVKQQIKKTGPIKYLQNASCMLKLKLSYYTSIALQTVTPEVHVTVNRLTHSSVTTQVWITRVKLHITVLPCVLCVTYTLVVSEQVDAVTMYTRVRFTLINELLAIPTFNKTTNLYFTVTIYGI